MYFYDLQAVGEEVSKAEVIRLRDSLADWIERTGGNERLPPLVLAEPDALRFRQLSDVIRAIEPTPLGAIPVVNGQAAGGQVFTSWTGVVGNIAILVGLAGALVFGAAFVHGACRSLVWHHRSLEGRCITCGYDLAGLALPARCPECGQAMQA